MYQRDGIAYDPETGMFKRRRGEPEWFLPCIGTHGYRVIRIGYRNVRAHRVAWYVVHGYWPKEIDHINRDRADNRLCNLRECTRSENILNASVRKDNTTGHKGVSPHTKGGYQANYRGKYLGWFKTVDEAIEARRVAESFA